MNDFPLLRSLCEDFAAGAEVDVAGKGAQHEATGEIVEGRGRCEGGGDARQGRGRGVGEANHVARGIVGARCVGGSGGSGREREERHGVAVGAVGEVALEFEGKARRVGGETRTTRFALAASGEEGALVGEAAPTEGDVGAVLDGGAEIERRGQRGAVGAHGVGREIGVGEVDDDKRTGVGGIVGGVFGALSHDTEAHGVEGGE